MTKESLKVIGEIDFNDLKVKIWYDPKPGGFANGSFWRIRNPDSLYKGIVYMNNETRKITYPDGAIIPEQTEKDREMIPLFYVTQNKEFTDELILFIKTDLEIEYTRRNNIKK